MVQLVYIIIRNVIYDVYVAKETKGINTFMGY